MGWYWPFAGIFGGHFQNLLFIYHPLPLNTRGGPKTGSGEPSAERG